MTPSILIYRSEDSLEIVTEVLPRDQSCAFRTTLIVTGLEGTNSWFRKKLEERTSQFEKAISPLVLRFYPTPATARQGVAFVDSAFALFVKNELAEFGGIISAVETVEMESVSPSH